MQITKQNVILKRKAVFALFFIFLFIPFWSFAGSEAPKKTYADDDALEKKEGFSVTPVVANEKAKPRDIIKKELLISNNTNQRADLYITVENVNPENGDEEFKSPSVSDLSTSLANWIEITRGVIELAPNESRKIPYLIHVNLTAKPGNYYARIKFGKGSTRAAAEASDSVASLMLSVEVIDDAKERLQLGNFITDNGIVFGDSASFSYLLENIGNRKIEPRGSIRIFNRRGEEVGSIPLNADGKEITPDNKKQLAAAWSTTGRFGKYKAFLDLEYGENQLASVQDTVYFWVFPWKEIMVALFGIIVLAVFGTYVVHMRAIAQPSYVRNKSKNNDITKENVAMETSSFSNMMNRNINGGNSDVTVLAKTQRENNITLNKKNNSVVELTSLRQRNKPKTHGNVVQLSSRR
jgi:hypothetical protein